MRLWRYHWCFGAENINNDNVDSAPKQTEQGDKKDAKQTDKNNKQDKDSNESNGESIKSESKSQDKSTDSGESTIESTDNSTKSAESAPLSPTTKEESGLMIGVGFLMGGKIGNVERTELNFLINSSTKPFYYGAEVILGHKTFFGESGIFGMRLYLDYNYRRTKGSALSMHFVGLTIDTLFNIYQTEAFKVGVLAGVRSGLGFGLAQCGDMESCKSDMDIDWTADLNIGARMIIYDHNAFEFVLQPRFGLLVLKGKNSMYGIIRYIYTF